MITIKSLDYTALIGYICFNTETNDFDQQTMCGAPVPWSKYTTFLGSSAKLLFTLTAK